MGIALGGLLIVLANLVDPLLVRNGFGSIAKVHPVWLLLSGVFIFNFLTPRRKRTELDDEAEKELVKIELGEKKGLLSKAQARMHYNAVIRRHLDRTVLKEPEKSD